MRQNSPLRVLILDDEPDIHTAAEESAGRLAEAVEICGAKTATEAVSLVNSKYIDLAIIDLVGEDGSLVGLEFLRYLSQMRVGADVVLMTHLDFEVDHGNIMEAIAASEIPHVVRFIDKRRSHDFFLDAIDGTLRRHRGRACLVENSGVAARLILERRNRYARSTHTLSLRDDDEEIGLEVERLCQRLFAEVPLQERRSAIAVRLEPLNRLGLSAAAVLRARVSLGVEGIHAESTECVLKVGPRDEVQEEAARYLEFVRFGVPLEERVEFLGHAIGDSLGAIVYSMVGGSRGSIHSLDELMSTAPAVATAVIDRLFSHTSWYQVSAGKRPPREFFRTTYRTDFVHAFDLSIKPLSKACSAAGAELAVNPGAEPVVKLKGGLKFPLPGREYSGGGPMLRSRPWCLVHGDMHGGNVLVELEGAQSTQPLESRPNLWRVSLIDYRQAGPGPRCVDAAALECAIRLSDAEGLRGRFAAEDGVSEEGLHAALTSVKLERALLDMEWNDSSTGLMRSAEASEWPEWVELSLAVVRGARLAFAKEAEPVTKTEYLQTCILYGLRQLRYPMKPASRLRIAAWVGAVYERSN